MPIILFRPGPDTRPNAFSAKLVTEPDSIQYLSWMNTGGFNVNKRESRAAEIGGGGGVANARGLAGMYVPLANDGRVNGRELISKSRIDAMRQVSVATMCDANLLLPTRFGQGFMLTMDNRWQPPHEENSAILGAGAFGHVGAGGSIGFADPERRLAMGYAMTRMGGGLLLNERGQALVDAVYPALGCTGTDSGFWA